MQKPANSWLDLHETLAMTRTRWIVHWWALTEGALKLMASSTVAFRSWLTALLKGSSLHTGAPLTVQAGINQCCFLKRYFHSACHLFLSLNACCQLWLHKHLLRLTVNWFLLKSTPWKENAVIENLPEKIHWRNTLGMSEHIQVLTWKAEVSWNQKITEWFVLEET